MIFAFAEYNFLLYGTQIIRIYQVIHLIYREINNLINCWDGRCDGEVVIGDAKTRIVCTTAETAESSSGAAELAEERAGILIGPQLL